MSQKDHVKDFEYVLPWASAGGGGKTGVCLPMEIGIKNQKFLENLW